MCHHRAKGLGNTVAYCTSQDGKDIPVGRGSNKPETDSRVKTTSLWVMVRTVGRRTAGPSSFSQVTSLEDADHTCSPLWTSLSPDVQVNSECATTGSNKGHNPHKED
ncbi:uncharacterized protein [Dermacentor albipictus]|uniref:uncharacterized protein isoform X2 n=1 Tax=Dermacentor albipictus TaxID=60249 RepID=UPI0031FDFCF0